MSECITVRNVNGVSIERLEVGFLNRVEGIFDIYTTNIGVDKQLELLFSGFLA